MHGIERPAGGLPEVFALWQPSLADVAAPTSEPEADPGELSFSVGGSPAPPREPVEQAIWSLDLDGDPRVVGARLGLLERQTRQSDVQLRRAPGRLESCLLEAENPAPEPDSFDVSFAAPGFASGSPKNSLPDAEHDLLGALRPAPEDPEMVSFAASSPLQEIERAGEELREALRGFSQQLTHAAFVESRASRRLLGRTAVSWTGATGTCWQIGVRPEQCDLHQRNVALAVQSRLVLLRTITLIQRVAVRLSKVASLSATGVGTAAALPLAWKYTRQILAEIADLRAQSAPLGR